MKTSMFPRLALLLLFLVVLGASVRNVFVDAGVVEAEARAEACRGRGPRCSPALTRLLRTPLFQDLRFLSAGDTIEVRCRRSLYLVGNYACWRRAPPGQR
jgi:hypothetical protein